LTYLFVVICLKQVPKSISAFRKFLPLKGGLFLLLQVCRVEENKLSWGERSTKMKKVLPVLLTLAFPTAIFATAGLSLRDANDGDSIIYVNPGESFTITAHVVNDTGKDLYGLGFWLEDADNTTFFTIENINHLTPWDPTTSPEMVAGQPLMPINSNDLGAVGSSSEAIAGDFDFAEITLSVDPAAAASPGYYDIILPSDSSSGVGYEGTTTGELGLPEPVAFDLANPITVYVPEPASALLFLAAVPFIRRRR